MSEDSQRPIVVKRVKKSAHGHHGGAWKIAYADFVTAMMAFFLLMWLLGSTASGDLKGISEFFQTPLKVAMMGGSGSGDSSSLIKGGGKDLTRTEGQVKQGEIREEKKVINLKAAEAERARKERLQLGELKNRIERAIEGNAALQQFRKQMVLDITTEGLRIQILDEYNRPMFSSGSAQLQSYSRDILREIGKSLNDVSNRISISGHTDAQPYAGGNKGYSNWELSADRSNAARRELIGGGLDESRIVRVVGLSSAVPLDAENPLNAVNRRISIIIMNKKTEEAASKDGGTVATEETDQAAEETSDAGTTRP
ncbi:MAG: flagellar motor protein MotB [Dechloromonas sp.]|nr:flagellar motor protein MotB [Dechloromonas sp.]